MRIQPIGSVVDHTAVVMRIAALWDARPRTPENDETGLQSVLVSAYEDLH